MKQTTIRKHAWLLGAATVFGTAAAPVLAQESNNAPAPVSVEEVVVQAQIRYRNRTDEAAPVLQYDTDYFQRFEPLTAGDALKRVPSVAFLSDILESDGVRLRGLDPAYTQVMINGEQVPGSGDSSGAFGNGADSAFFVDRIPAELIERVEIVRSQSANRSGDAVAGALNIVLRDAYSLNGGYVRGGVQFFDGDDNWGETLGGVWGGEALGGRLLAGANMQDRHNPKEKTSYRYDEPGAPLNDIEIQSDVRDGTDYSGNFSYDVDAFGGELSLDGFYVHTDRYQNEDSIEYESGIVGNPTLLTLNSNDVDIEQDSWSLNAGLEVPWFGGETRFKAGYASFTNDVFEFENEVEYDDPNFPEADEYSVEQFLTSLEDNELKLKVEHERDLRDGLTLEFGLQYESKERDNLTLARDHDDNFAGGTVVPNASLAEIVAADPGFSLGAYAPVTGGDNTIERTRLDPYLMLSGESGAFKWEAGLRYQTTETTITDRDPLNGGTIESTDETLLPSAHASWEVSDTGRILASVARTIRYPSFVFLSPAILEEEVGDHDFRGSATLQPETAWGIDIGYEHRLGNAGVVGINFFYRDVTDLIEVFADTTDIGSNGLPTLTPRNSGDGTVRGIEFDLSTPLTVFGLENTGVFLNYSWLDSETTDDFGERPFNSQAQSIFNVGFIQDLPSLNTSFGVTYRKQGDAESRIIGEEVSTAYGADLEAFVEHRIGERFTIRLTGSNLLDSSKDEAFNKFNDLNDHLARNFDEYELETESAGPVYQLVGRYAF